MKDWTKNCPPYDTQYSALTHTDVQDCTAESFCHIYFMLTGVRVSPRALAVMAGLQNLDNRTVDNVLATANKYGLVPWEACPTPDSFTMESYYTSLTASENVPFPVSIVLTALNLNISPLWTELAWGLNLDVPTRHMVAQINQTQYFDSEQGAPIKPLNYEGAVVVYQTSLIIKPMPQIVSLNLHGTEGIFLEAATPAEWQALCLVFGKDPQNPDKVV